jgi:hypothetical protein
MRIFTAKLAVALCTALLAAGCGAATTAASHTATAQTTPGTSRTATQAPATVTQGVLTAEQVTTALQRQGFEPKAKVTAYTSKTDPNELLGRQGGYTSKTEWSEPDGSFDSVEVYPTTAGATERAAILGSISGGLIGDGYDYQQGPVILRLSKALTPLQAGLAYSDMLNALAVKGT